MTKSTILALLLSASAATPAAAVVDITKIPAKTFAFFSQIVPVRGAVPKLGYYKNEDVVKTTGVTVKTPHTVTTSVKTATIVNVTTYVFKPVTTKDPITGKSTTKQVRTAVVTPTPVTTTKFVATTTYTSVTTYSTKITPKAELYSTIGSGSALGSPVFNFSYLSDNTPQFNAYLQPKLAGLQKAATTLHAVSTSAAVINGSSITQVFDSGSLSFARTAPIFTLGKHPRPLSNLLKVVFTNATLYGTLGSTSFTLDASTPTSTITYTSDFLNFQNTFNNDFSLTFNAASPALAVMKHALTANNQTNVTGAHSLRSTRATFAGQFAASSVPEPAMWSLMLAGFAMIGLRRRRAPSRSVIA